MPPDFSCWLKSRWVVRHEQPLWAAGDTCHPSSAPCTSPTWADMSISLGSDNLLPSSVFRKSSRHPKKREVASALLQSDPALVVPVSPWCERLPTGGGKWEFAPSDLSVHQEGSTYCCRVPSTLQNASLSTPGAANMPAVAQKLGFSQVQGPV